VHSQARLKINFGDSIAQPHQLTILFSIVGNHANVMIVGTDPGQSRAVISRKPIEYPILAQTTWDHGPVRAKVVE
jgi:hypothetical protein